MVSQLAVGQWQGADWRQANRLQNGRHHTAGSLGGLSVFSKDGTISQLKEKTVSSDSTRTI